MKISSLGWIISAAMVGGIAASAYKQKTDKIGFVDFGAAFAQSSLKAKESAQFDGKATSLRSALDFVQLNDIFTGDQLGQFQSLVLKDSPTQKDQDDLKKLEADVTTATKLFDTLRQKPNPTAQDTQQLNDLANDRNMTRNSLPQLQQSFSNYMQDFKEKQAEDASDQIQKAVEKVAKAQGYTLVFSDTSALYGGDDLTPAVSKELGK